MSLTEIIALLALIAYAVYKQTQRQEIVGSSRFRLAIIYAVVGLAVGTFTQPNTLAEWLLLATGIALSVAVGIARGRLTRLWAEDDETGHHVYAQGTAVTIGLFLGLVLVKFALGTVAYLYGISDDGGFGEVLVMIAVMIAFQAELVWRRAQALGAPASLTTTT